MTEIFLYIAIIGIVIVVLLLALEAVQRGIENDQEPK